MIRTTLLSIAMSTTLLVSLSSTGWSQPETPTEAKTVQVMPVSDDVLTTPPTNTTVSPATPVKQNYLTLQESRLPEATQVYLRTPATLEGIYSSYWLERILDTPLGDYLMQEIVNEFGELPILLRQDVLPYVQGNLVFAVVRNGNESLFERINRSSSQDDAYQEVQRQVGFLGKEVATFKNKFNRLPKNWDEMVQKKIRKAVPSSEYAEFVIRPEGQEWTVAAIYRDKLNLSSYAPPPSFSSKRGISRLVTPSKPLNALLAFDSSNVNKLREALNSSRAQQVGISHIDPTHWKLKIEGLAPWILALKDNQLVASDNELLLGDFLETPGSTATGKREGRLSENRRFRHQLDQLGQAGPRDLWAFIDLQDIVSSSPSLGFNGARLNQFESLGLISRRTFKPDGSVPYQVSTQAFLQVATNITSGPSALIPSNVTTPANWDFVANLPSQTAIVYAWQTGECSRLFELFSTWYPSLHDMTSTFTAQLQQSLGSAYTVEDVRNDIGWICSENEFLSRLFQLGMQLWLGTGPWGGTTGTLSGVIQTFAGSITIELKDPKVSAAIADKLIADIPRMESAVSIGSSRYWMNREHNFGIAQLPDRLVASSRATKQIFFHGLEVQSGLGLRILDEPFWNEFQASVSGRPLFFMHEKVDGPYSILKGLLLIFDSGTRATAEEIGNYRDCYVAATVEPTGLHLYSGVYSAASMPSKSSITSSQDLKLLLEALRRSFQTPMPTPKRKR